MADAPHGWTKVSIAFAIALGIVSFTTQQCQRRSDLQAQALASSRESEKHEAELQQQRNETARARAAAERAAAASERIASSNQVLATAANDAAEAQRRAAHSAEENLTLVTKNFEFENRPEVTMKDIDTDLSNGKITVKLSFTNTGKSEALITRSYCQLYYDNVPLGAPSASPLQVYLGAGTYEVPCSAAVNDNQVQAIQSGSHRVIWRGGLAFDDMFGHKGMTTHACLEYDPNYRKSLHFCRPYRGAPVTKASVR